MKNKFLALLILFLPSQIISSQDVRGEDWAKQNVYEAITLMDNGQYDKSIDLLKESIEISPDNLFYRYELGLAYCKKGDYKESAKIYEKLINHKDVHDQVYQMLGNVYDMWGKRDKAIKIYEKGMKKFPNSGRLYLERSVIYLSENQYNEALTTLEKGVSVDPMYPSNYYWLTKIFLENSQEEVWGMLYGELFRLLEPQSPRSDEISKLLYDTYKKEISIKGDSISVSFCKNTPINIAISEKSLDDPSNLAKLLQQAVRRSFGTSIYEPTLLLSLVGMQEINLKTLSEMRSRFVDLYIEKHYKEYPIVLFDFQKKVKEAGHLEAYTYWLLLFGDETEYDKWLSEDENALKMRNFAEWYEKNINEFTIDQENKFLRIQ